MVIQSRGKYSQADQAIRHHQPLHGKHLFIHQLVAFALHEEEFHAPPEVDFQGGRIPRLGDIFVNGPGVDCHDGGIEIGIGGGKNAQRSWGGWS